MCRAGMISIRQALAIIIDQTNQQEGMWCGVVARGPLPPSREWQYERPRGQHAHAQAH